jgi:tyrosinase
MQMTFEDFERLGREQGEISIKLEDIFGALRRTSVTHVDQSIIDLLNLALSRPRKNQASLSQSERDAFNNAVQAAEADGSYGRIADIHMDMSHRMHTMMNHIYDFIGGMRFLPWHRVYVSVMESQLQMYEPNLLIPYWDWANDHTLPSWVYLPAGVTRGPDPNYSLPTQQDINANVMSHSDYAGMTISGMDGNGPPGLELYHGRVHMWVGGNTMPEVMTSPHDPMFWLHHANVDRLWAQWQSKYPGVLPPLTRTHAAMDPWSLVDVIEANDTYNFRYFYA